MTQTIWKQKPTWLNATVAIDWQLPPNASIYYIKSFGIIYGLSNDIIKVGIFWRTPYCPVHTSCILHYLAMPLIYKLSYMYNWAKPYHF